MNSQEVSQRLKSLRLGGMASTLETRLLESQSASLAPIDFLSALVQDELDIRADRLIARRIKQARFRNADKRLENFDFGFNPKIPKRNIFELATCKFIERREDVLFLGPPGVGKSHLAQALGHAAILQGHTVWYLETHRLLEELHLATLEDRRPELCRRLTKVSLLIIDDLGMRKLPKTAAEDLLEIIMRRHETASTILTSNRPVDEWGKLLGDTPAVGAMLDRLLHHGHAVTCGPKSYRTARTLVNKGKEE